MNTAAPKMLDFFEFIYDRQNIWHKRFVLKQNAPWADNPWMSKFCYCNVYRELDRGTIHLLDNIIKNDKYDLEEKVFNIIVYRKFNTSYFFDHLSKISPYDYDVSKTVKEMDIQSAAGIKLWKNAYMVASPSHKKKPKKHVQMMRCLRPISKDIKLFTKALFDMPYKEAHQFILDSIPGTGPFLAQQYLIDMTYIKIPKHWDVNGFVDVGPGARPAAKLLMPDNTPVEACFAMQEIQFLMFNELKEKTGKDWNEIYYKNSFLGGKAIRLSDIQNCLCEFRKYCHLQTNPNKKKRYYKGDQSGAKRTQD